LKKEDLQMIMNIIKPVDSESFKSTKWEDLNIDREGGLVILPTKFAVVKVLDKKRNKVRIMRYLSM
jgi:hypothetical protein